MKKIVLLSVIVMLFNKSNAQNGLENVVVEKYYVSDANDTLVNADGGVLPIGSVTYRVFADMLPGYKFQAVYGVPDHEMRIETTTLFFNNEDRGATSPTYSKTQAANNTVMLDSWLSVGAACNGQIGVMKVDDDGAANVMNADGVLQNADTSAGIPLTQEDGMVAGTPEPVTVVGINTEVAVFDNQNDGTNGPLFSTFNGSWASLNGSVGADTISNKVLIAQITTDGVFSFELNIQIGTPTGGVENYVASNPVASEIQMPSLIYNSSIGTGIKAQSAQKLFSIYPSPASDNLRLLVKSTSTSSENAQYKIFDAFGKVVYAKSLGRIGEYYLENIDISSIAAGVYFLEVENGNAKSIQRFIKQ